MKRRAGVATALAVASRSTRATTAAAAASTVINNTTTSAELSIASQVAYARGVFFKANGSQLVSVQAPGQTFSSFFGTFENGGNPDSTFVLNLDFGGGGITGFGVNGADHDTLSFSGSDFDNSVAAGLQNTQQQKGGAVIVDPVTGDSVKLFGIGKQRLVADRQDFTFHA